MLCYRPPDKRRRKTLRCAISWYIGCMCWNSPPSAFPPKANKHSQVAVTSSLSLRMSANKKKIVQRYKTNRNMFGGVYSTTTIAVPPLAIPFIVLDFPMVSESRICDELRCFWWGSANFATRFDCTTYTNTYVCVVCGGGGVVWVWVWGSGNCWKWLEKVISLLRTENAPDTANRKHDASTRAVNVAKLCVRLENVLFKSPADAAASPTEGMIYTRCQNFPIANAASPSDAHVWSLSWYIRISTPTGALSVIAPYGSHRRISNYWPTGQLNEHLKRFNLNLFEWRLSSAKCHNVLYTLTHTHTMHSVSPFFCAVSPAHISLIF